MLITRSQRGFTLLEILIAIVIFSIGLLGIARLQIAGMRFTHGSQLRSTAVQQAESMADLMRANEYGMRKGNYNFLNQGTDMPTAAPFDCAVVPCNATNRATYDLVNWNTSNTNVLPGDAEATGAVCRDSTPDDGSSADWACDNLGNVYAIKVQWLERSSPGADTDTDSQDNDLDDELHRERLVMRVIPSLDETP